MQGKMTFADMLKVRMLVNGKQSQPGKTPRTAEHRVRWKKLQEDIQRLQVL